MIAAATRKTSDSSLFLKLLDLMRTTGWMRNEDREFDLLELLDSPHAKPHDELIISLLKRMIYIDSASIQRALVDMRVWVEHTQKLTPSNTFFVPKKSSKIDSSLTMIGAAQSAFADSKINKWSRRNFLHDKSAIPSDPGTINIVLLDDFSGTGKSVRTFIDWFDEHPTTNQDRVFFGFFIAAMNETQNNVDLKKMTIHSLHWISKGISDHYANPTPQINAMKAMERSMMRVGSYSLGYEASETLFKAELFNIPNNNFPILWHSSLNYKSNIKPIFGRL